MNNKKEAKKSEETSRKSPKTGLKQRSYSCLLYTSDAADETLWV